MTWTEQSLGAAALAVSGPHAVTDRDEVKFLPPEIATMPPLIKGYLRVGGFVGDGAVIDYQFGTTDVCVIVKTDLIAAQYYKQFVQDAQGQSSSRRSE